MYRIKKRMEIASAHALSLSYESKCKNLHGHNWIITVYIKSQKLNSEGMLMDFAHIKQKIHGRLDHSIINDILPVNPTAEHIAFWICNELGVDCYKVKVQESEGNTAIYER